LENSVRLSDYLAKTIIALGMLLTMSPAVATPQGGHKHARPELGTAAAFDSKGRLWIASKESVDGGAYVTLQMSEDLGKTWSAPKRVQHTPEPLAADGEARPKLAFGTRDEIYITYTKPLSKPYTGDVRFVRSVDGGKTFSAPVTVHANRDVITHRFDSISVDKGGRIYVTWIDKRDLEGAKARGEKYAGAAVYYAVSDDAGKSFRGDYKIADHSCECCRIALVPNPQGGTVALWRHVFDGDTRDHALAELHPDGKVPAVQRATFDEWKINACPHHGPSMAFTPDGRRHQVWFNVKQGEGGVFYASAGPDGALGQPQRLGSEQAAHADLATEGNRVAIAWKQFDGKSTAIIARVSDDGGRTWRETEVARTKGNSDQPRVAAGKPGIVLVWRTQDEGVRTVPLK
jgi:hypothetical protein